MSKDKHTPGPWRVTAVGQCGRQHSPRSTQPLFTVDVRAKDNSNPCVFVFTESEEKQNLANAHLIAASPALLSAAEKALEWLTGLKSRDKIPNYLKSLRGPQLIDGLRKRVITNLRAAINDAKPKE